MGFSAEFGCKRNNETLAFVNVMALGRSDGLGHWPSYPVLKPNMSPTMKMNVTTGRMTLAEFQPFPEPRTATPPRLLWLAQADDVTVDRDVGVHRNRRLPWAIFRHANFEIWPDDEPSPQAADSPPWRQFLDGHGFFRLLVATHSDAR